jgi:hypothetical protein
VADALTLAANPVRLRERQPVRIAVVDGIVKTEHALCLQTSDIRPTLDSIRDSSAGVIYRPLTTSINVPRVYAHPFPCRNADYAHYRF